MLRRSAHGRCPVSTDRARSGSLFAQHGLEKEPVASIRFRQQAPPAPVSGVGPGMASATNVGPMRQMG